MKKITIIWIVICFLAISNGIVFYINHINATKKIDMILDDSIDHLEKQYDTLLKHQATIADTSFRLIKNKEGFLPLYNQVSLVKNQDVLRKKLYTLLQNDYKIMKEAGVSKFQFFLPNNEVFLMMSKKDNYGENVSSFRSDIKYSNDNKEITRRLMHGDGSHEFRNIYPVFSNEKVFLGLVEISFSSENFSASLNSINGVNSHLLVDKDILKFTNTKNNLPTFLQSSEHENFVIPFNKIDVKKIYNLEGIYNLVKVKEEIKLKINNNKKFALHIRTGTNKIKTISFLPIQTTKNGYANTWLVSYIENRFIYDILQKEQLINVFSIFILSLFSFFVYQQVMGTREINIKHALLDDVLNTSEDIIFVTNFESVSFYNKKFKTFINIEFPEHIQNILSYFIEMPGYLNKGLLENNETFDQLILKTNKEDRVVCLMDGGMNPKAFAVSIAKSTHNDEDYLVTLTDITKLKEKELKISNKAFYDGLTGVYNRNKFDELVSFELERYSRYKNTLSIAIVDIDHFKNFNDTYGHLVGDEILILLAQYLNKSVRETDIFARWGGEEFVILFPETSKENTQYVCDKLRIGIESLNHAVAGGVTASFGLTQCKEGDTLDSLFKRCDDALYDAKENGRNQVCIR